MRSASFQIESDRPPASLRRRGSAFLLALAAELLIVLALITVAWRPPSLPKPKPEPNTFSLIPPPPKEKVEVKKPSRKGGHARSDVVKVRPPPPIVPPVLSKPALNPLLNDKELFDAADISKMHSDTGMGNAKAYGPGEGQGGEAVAHADWYPRPPTSAEMAHYLPKDMPSVAWADISCKLIADYHVENCRSVAESPVGTGLARSLRLASWQFRVRIRRGEKVTLGERVLIHYEFRVVQEKRRGADPEPGPDPDPDPQ